MAKTARIKWPLVKWRLIISGLTGPKILKFDWWVVIDEEYIIVKNFYLFLKLDQLLYCSKTARIKWVAFYYFVFLSKQILFEQCTYELFLHSVAPGKSRKYKTKNDNLYMYLICRGVDFTRCDWLKTTIFTNWQRRQKEATFLWFRQPFCGCENASFSLEDSLREVLMSIVVRAVIQSNYHRQIGGNWIV